VSPKHWTDLVVHTGNELKVVYPQEFDPLKFALLEFQHFYIVLENRGCMMKFKAILFDSPKYHGTVTR